MVGAFYLRNEAADGELVASHRTGDASAFAVLYLRYRLRIQRYVALRVTESHAVEDLTQEAFAKALSSMHQLRNPDRFYPWLITITRRLVMSHYATRARTTTLPELLVDVSDPPDAELLRQATEQEMTTALARVTSRHRAVLELRERQQLSYAAIARRMDTSETAIPTLLHRARNALRREFMAVTDGERLGVIAAAIFGTVSLRRVRDRLGSLLRSMPDPAVWSGSMAGIAVVVSMAIGSGAVSPDATAEVPALAVSVTVPGGQATAAHHESARNVRDTHDAGHDPGDAGIRRVEFDNGFRLGSYGVGKEAARRGYEDNQHMPYHMERGRTSVGIDPQPLQDHVELLLGEK